MHARRGDFLLKRPNLRWNLLLVCQDVAHNGSVLLELGEDFLIGELPEKENLDERRAVRLAHGQLVVNPAQQLSAPSLGDMIDLTVGAVFLRDTLHLHPAVFFQPFQDAVNLALVGRPKAADRGVEDFL